MENLTDIRENLKAIKPLEHRAAALDKRLLDAQTEAADLLERFHKESIDVEQIQKESLTSFILKRLGKYEERLEKEKREAITAKINFDKAAANCDELLREKRELERRLAELHRLAQDYELELSKRRDYISQSLSEPGGIRFNQLEDEIDEIISQLTEISEALRAAANVSDTIQSARNSLESADDWATFDLWTRGGIITHAAKYSHIDDAEACFNLLYSQLSTLKSELSDVKSVQMSEFAHISPGQRSVDFWLDNIFTDISVREQIRENLSKLDKLADSITQVTQQLHDSHQQLNGRLTVLRQQQEELLLSL